MRTFKFLHFLLLMACFSLEASGDVNPGNLKGEKVAEFLISSTQFINGTMLLVPLGDSDEITITLNNAKQNKRGVLRFSVYLEGELVGAGIVKDNKFRANINYGGSQYRIAKPKDSDKTTVLKYSQNPGIKEHPELQEGHGPIDKVSAGSRVKSSTRSMAKSSFAVSADVNVEPEESIVRVFVAYTAAADEASDDIESLIDLAFAETNIAYAGSEIPHTIELAGTVLIEDYVENADVNLILKELQANNDGVMDEIHAARKAANADMVVLIVDQPQHCGVSYLNSSYTTAFSVVHYSCATGYYSFGHEIGHNFALRHNVEVDDKTVPFSDGHGYQSPAQNARTLMSYDCENSCVRYPLFSNPAVNFTTGDAAGDLSFANNARILNINMPQYAKLAEKWKEGDLVWQHTSSSDYGFFSHPVIDETMTFSSDLNGLLHAFNNQTGEVIWIVEDTSWHNLSLFGDILYASSDVRTIALKKQTGEILWEYLFNGNKKHAIDGEGNLYTLHYTGIKKFSPEGRILNVTSVVSGRVSRADPLININKQLIYVMTKKGVAAYALDDLSLVWDITIPKNVESENGWIIMDHDTVYHYLAGKNLSAISALTGELLWQREGETASLAVDSPIMDTKYIYYTNGRVITAFSKITGDIVWEKNPFGYGSPKIVATGTSLIAIKSDQYSILNIDTGEVESTYHLDAIEADASGPALTPSGLLMYQDNNGMHVYQTGEFPQSDLVWGIIGANLSRTYSIQQFIDNSVPVLEVQQPLNNAIFKHGDAIVLSATALDEEDGDISGNILWASDLDGEISSLQMLSASQHIITAKITDSGNESVTSSVTITIFNTSDLTVALTGAPGKNYKGLVTFEALISNIGEYESTNTVIELNLPVGVSFISASNAEDCSTVNLLVTCQVVDITPRTEHKITYVVSTGDFTKNTHEYQVAVSAENDFVSGNNRRVNTFDTHEYQVPVSAENDLVSDSNRSVNTSGGSFVFIALLLLLVLAMRRKINLV
jgi:outer membrane protein assembly factor BamB